MKKFLFTLAALLMAGSAFADDYFYVEDFEVSKEMLAQTAAKDRRVTVPVKAHFDAYVNSWQVDFGSVDGTNMDPKPVDNTLPAGVTMRATEAGPGMTITAMNAAGNDKNYAIELGMGQNNTRYIATVGVIGGYWYPDGSDPDEDDPVTYGSIKWAADDYDCMFNVTFQFAQDFAGGEIWIRSAPASGADARGPITNGVVTYHKLTISVEQDAPVPANKPVITVNNNNTTAVSFTIAGEEGATIYYKYGNMTEYAVYTGEVTETVEGNYTVEAYAVGPNGKTESEHATENFTVVAPAPVQADEPTIKVANDNTTEVTVTIEGEAGAKLYYEVTPANRAYAEYTEALVYTTPGTYTIEAYAVGPNGKIESKHATETFTVKAPDQPTPAGSFTYESDWQKYYFTVTGDNAQLIIDNEVATTNTIERPAYGQDPITVSVQVTTNKGEGYTPTTTEAQTVTILPQLPEVSISAVPGQASADWIPGVGYDNIVEGNYYDVSFAVNANENDKTPYEIHYVITGPNGAKWEGVYDGEPIHLDKNGTYNVEAWAVYGEDAGKVATDSFKLDTNTGVNELVNGKTVAGVRYFNMAGQEMQEANGMTIVVTTYTDGTTSAVKVVK